MDEDSPMAALLAQHDQDRTFLDDHFDHSIYPKIESLHQNNSESETSNQHTRESMYSSLNSRLESSNDRNKADTEKDRSSPIIVFDNHTDDDNKPIGLSYRQPSFSSLTGDLIPKGEIAPDTQIKEIPEEEPRRPKFQPMNETKPSDSTNKSDDDNHKRVRRWKSAGYQRTLGNLELPDNIYPTQYNTTSEKSTPIVHNSNQKEECEEDYDDYFGYSEEEDEFELFGRLDYIVKEPINSVVTQVIKTGDLSNVSDPLSVAKVIRKYLNICNKNNWKEEANYLTELIQALEEPEPESRQSQIDEETEKLQISIDALFERYAKSAKKLDQKYSSQSIIDKYSAPSKELIGLKRRANRMLKAGNQKESERLLRQVRRLQKKESDEMTKRLRDKYLEDDRKLKESYAFKLYRLQQKYETKINKLK
ncbi:erythrocyte binding protein [Histomonas meleagridis]|uniref:erythrocyte binding protein n=1 Tax=Histomonas meleagridis TaxID=135588 RepID=UPI00355A6BD8|nr:erythrocyte binding protein [Histomonas meleagridis]KAH0797023.1 erythrocyte binding protein [Histomonas meleagridis]